MLAGGLRASSLQSLCRASVLDLCIRPGVTVLEHVLGRVASFRRAPGGDLAVAVVYGEPVVAPTPGPACAGLAVSIAAEPRRWRGPAGLLLDVCDDMGPDQTVLVVEGARWYGSAIASSLEAHEAAGADVTVVRAADDSPAGVYLMRRSALDLVPRNGFMDLKEQFLGKVLGAGKAVRVHEIPEGRALGLRSLADFLVAARLEAGAPPGASLIDPGAEVHAKAAIVSSVVMRGARIGEGALVARSMILEGADVSAGAEIVDSVVDAQGSRRAQGVFRALLAHEEQS
ncbi:MAG: hypothetical protein SFZ24_12255 [Planctomycetota bacterium]|nr:hypothetical protein [Planctomycetota bacterium]